MKIKTAIVTGGGWDWDLPSQNDSQKKGCTLSLLEGMLKDYRRHVQR